MSRKPGAPPADAPSEPARSGRVAVDLWRLEAGELQAGTDQLAAEEPLEIRLRAGEGEARAESPLAVTMRTPGADEELALGFLYAEGVITSPDEVRGLEVLEDPWGLPDAPSNVLAVDLRANELPDLARLERSFFVSSACGVCGRAGIESLRLRGVDALPEIGEEKTGAGRAGRAGRAGPWVAPEVLLSLPERLRASQGLFDTTGGLHAAALFSAEGELLALREDVGRHNALDKLIGWAFRERLLPLDHHLLLVSGRASFELVQKALVARAPLLAAVSAPSSLAVDLAREMNMTLVGFLRPGRFNVYAGRGRVG